MNRLLHDSRFDLADLIAATAIGLGLLAITYLHYSTAPSFVGLHAAYRYFYFLPIVYAALRFGSRGGLAAALLASALFAPHIIFKWGNFPGDGINDLLVIVVFLGVAVITGVTVDRLRTSQEAQQRTANELAASLRRLGVQGEELRRAERLSALGSLAGGLAHQIRNPVGIIRASAQLLAQEASPEVRETGQVIEEETDRVEHLVQDLLRYADGTRPQLTHTDANHLVERVVARVRPLADASVVNTQMALSAEAQIVAIDPRQMEQALLNLTVNAIQALEPGGTVILSARSSADRQYVELCVSDDGPGIQADDRQRIFDPFFSTKESGSGLGLSVVHRIVADHGARINVTSTPGSGAEFVIRLASARP